jgi:molecular chaperone GrpE
MAEKETFVHEKNPSSVNATEKTAVEIEAEPKVEQTKEDNEIPESVTVKTDSPATESSEPVTPVTSTETVEPSNTTAANDKAVPVEPVDATIAANDKAATDTATPKEATPSVEELMRQLAEASQKAETYWDTLLRKQAEFDNSQKRMTRELDNARKFALEKFATELLAVKDSMELGLEATDKPETTLESVQEGMKLTLKMFNDSLEKFDIKEINPLNDKFNPQWHEAMAMQPVPNVEDGTVLLVHQKGYQLNERLLRPARVIVAQAIPGEKPLENQG